MSGTRTPAAKIDPRDTDEIHPANSSTLVKGTARYDWFYRGKPQPETTAPPNTPSAPSPSTTPAPGRS
jgi:hypothetical protein